MQFNRSPSSVAATISGPVDTSGSTISVGNTPSVLSTDNFAVVFQQSVPGDYPNINAGGSTAILDVSKYQSVVINVGADGLNADFPMMVAGVVEWYGDPAAGFFGFNQTGIDNFYYRVPLGAQGTGAGSGGARLELPCKGARMRVTIPAQAAIPADAVADIEVYGSYKQLAPRYERTQTLEWGTSGTGTVSGDARFTSWTVNLGAGAGTFDERPPCRSGPATVALDVTTWTGTPTLALFDDYNAIPLAGSRNATVPVGTTIQNIMIPRRPLRFRASVAAAQALNARITLTATEEGG